MLVLPRLPMPDDLELLKDLVRDDAAMIVRNAGGKRFTSLPTLSVQELLLLALPTLLKLVDDKCERRMLR